MADKNRGTGLLTIANQLPMVKDLKVSIYQWRHCFRSHFTMFNFLLVFCRFFRKACVTEPMLAPLILVRLSVHTCVWACTKICGASIGSVTRWMAHWISISHWRTNGSEKCTDCDSYTFDVALIGPIGYGPRSDRMVSLAPEFDHRSPPKNVAAWPAISGSNDMAVISWSPPCVVLGRYSLGLGYRVDICDVTLQPSRNVSI